MRCRARSCASWAAWPLAALALVAACSRMPSLPMLAPSGGEALAALEYYERVAGMSVEQQGIEYAAAAGAFEVAPTDGNRLRLALVLSVPPWRDDARVVALLAGIETQARNDETAAVRQLALLLRKSAAERQRVREEARQDLRRRDTSLREEQRRNEELQQKLEALRAIERDMRRRVPRR